jgi:uncharacterized protein (TIGR02996 family)
MAVHFVYRCPYMGPSEKFVAHFEEATVLDWFRSRWAEMGARGYDSGDLPGVKVYGLGSLGEAIAEHALAAPTSAAELQALLEEHLYVEGEILFDEHCLQVLTDDDELQLAYFFFDDTWMAEHAPRAAFLLHSDWRLPTTARAGDFVPRVESVELDPAQDREGTVWINLNVYYDGMNLDGGTPYHVSGLRMDAFPAWLICNQPGEDWPFELRFLRSQLLQVPSEASPRERELIALIEADPSDPARWSVYSDWLLEQGRAPAPVIVMERALQTCADSVLVDQLSELDHSGLGGSLADARAEIAEIVRARTQKKGRSKRKPQASRSAGLVSCSAHLAQACLPVFSPDIHTHHQWIFFDDRWACAQPALARGVLRYVTRWDVLSIEG